MNLSEQLKKRGEAEAASGYGAPPEGDFFGADTSQYDAYVSGHAEASKLIVMLATAMGKASEALESIHTYQWKTSGRNVAGLDAERLLVHGAQTPDGQQRIPYLNLQQFVWPTTR